MELIAPMPGGKFLGAGLPQTMNYQLLVKIIYLVVFLVLCSAVSAAGLFLYSDFYKIYTQAEAINALSANVSKDLVNIGLWGQIREAQQIKQTSSLPSEGLRNPFIFGVTLNSSREEGELNGSEEEDGQ